MNKDLYLTIEADDRGGSGYLATVEFEDGMAMVASNNDEQVVTMTQDMFEELALKFVNEVM